MNKVKKGSAFYIVIIMTGVLCILGLSLISLTLSSYKLSKVASDKKFNFYMAESGLDKAYKIICDTVDEAVSTGNTSVDNFINNLNLEGEKQKVLLGVELKENMAKEGKEWTDALEKQYSSVYINYIDGKLVVNEEAIKEKQNEIFKYKYKKYIESNLENNIKNQDLYKFNMDGKDSYEVNDIKVLEVLLKNNSDNPLEFKEEKLNVELQSSYIKNSINKVIAVNYEIGVPNYKDAYYVEKDSVKLLENIIWKKGMVVDKNVNIATKNLTVNGDMYVNANDTNNDYRGIILNSTGNSNVNLLGNVVTPADFLIKSSNVNCDVKGNIYSSNVKFIEGADHSNLTVDKLSGDGSENSGSIYTKDDLEINSENNTINVMGGYFGLSDGSKGEGNNPDNSSSIIINSNEPEKVKLNIQGYSMVWGTAYINTGEENKIEDKYQTGESLAIKGNYVVYTSGLNSDEAKTTVGGKSLKEENVNFQYKEPLVLVESFKDGTNLNYLDKSDYFYYYYKEHEKDEELGGINLGNANLKDTSSMHVGTIMNNLDSEKVARGNYDNVSHDEMKREKMKKFNKMVYYMGVDKYGSEGEIVPSDKKGVKDFIDFGSLTSQKSIKNYNEFNTDEIVLLDGTENKYSLIGKGGSSVSGATAINLLNENTRGLIICNGDLYITGEINFKGTIIVGGNLYILDDAKKQISYDENVVKNLIARNYEKLKNTFKENDVDKFDNIEVSVKYGKDENIKTYGNKIIKRKNWKIEK